MTKQRAKLYPTPGKTMPSVFAVLSQFAKAHQGLMLSACDLPSCVREKTAAYLPEIERSGYRLLSSDSHPGLLIQGQFMFWPLNQNMPTNLLPPAARKYTPLAVDRPIGIDLFAGAGGLSMGFEQAGFDIAACVEIDPIHCATHEYNFPYAASICGSVTDLSGDAIRRRTGIGKRDIDVVFGGAPCQGFSMIGKRALDDPRNQLVSHYVRLVKELRPKYCVFENVKGLTVGRHAQFLNELVDALKATGYGVVLPYRVLNAADYGVPQNRMRLFLLAYRDGQNPPVYPHACKHKVAVGEAIGDLPNADTFEALSDSDTTHAVWSTQAAYAKRLRGLAADPNDFSYPRAFDRDRLTCSLRTVHTEASITRFSAAVSGTTEPISRFFKLSADGQCNTLRAGTDSARGAFTSPRRFRHRPTHAQKGTDDNMSIKLNLYAVLMEKLFFAHYKPGLLEFTFARDELSATAAELDVALPKNLGDVVYSFRYRNPLPQSILATADQGLVWIIKGAGLGRYLFKQARASRIEPDAAMLPIKVPNATYVGIDRRGRQFIVPVQAKVGRDQHGVVQTEQDIAFCQERFPGLLCRAVSVHALKHNRIALFELAISDDEVGIVDQKHYTLVPSSEITVDDLRRYGSGG